ncbi:MAG: OmpA family protein [Vibrio sp.]
MKKFKYTLIAQCILIAIPWSYAHASDEHLEPTNVQSNEIAQTNETSQLDDDNAFIETLASIDENYVDEENTSDTAETFDYQQNPHFYIGAKAGWSKLNDACDSSSNDCDDSSFAYGLYAGYKLLPWFSVETAFNDYGEPDAQYDAGNVSNRILDFQISGLFSYEVINNVSPFIRLGGAYGHMKKESDWDGNNSDHYWRPVGAVGVDYAFARNWSIRAEYQFIDGIGSSTVAKADSHLTSIGITYHFGQPAPQVVPAAAPEPDRILYVDSDLFFSTDSSEIADPTPLNGIAEDLQAQPEDVLVIGHTDSTGSEEYNQKLSEKRAQSVSDYLQTQGIGDSQIRSEGKGELEPIADNSTAEGRAKNRRVEIQFTDINENE